MRKSTLIGAGLATLTAIVGMAGTRGGVHGKGVASRPPVSAVAETVQPSIVRQGDLREGTKRQDQRRHRRDSLVWADGQVVSALRASELPAALAPHPAFTEPGDERYTLKAYFAAIGVDLQRVRAIHFHGSSIGVMDGRELRRVADRTMLSFWGGDRAKARIHWPHESVAINSTMDGISNLALYLTKPPPRLEASGALNYPDGRPVDGIAYAEKGAEKGTRVYIDGRLSARINRQTAGLGGGGSTVVQALAAGQVIVPPSATLELIASDVVVGRSGELRVSVPGGTGGLLALAEGANHFRADISEDFTTGANARGRGR